MKQLFLILTLSLLTSTLFALEVGDSIPTCSQSITTIYASTPDQLECIENFDGAEFLLVDFMSIYCGSCTITLPVINKIGLDYKNKVKTRFVAIDRDAVAVGRYWKTYQYDISHAFMIDSNRSSLKAYGLKATPTTFLVGKDGKILYKHVGEFYEAELEALEDLLR